MSSLVHTFWIVIIATVIDTVWQNKIQIFAYSENSYNLCFSQSDSQILTD